MRNRTLLSLLLSGLLLSATSWAQTPVAYITNTNVDLKNRLIYGELVYDTPDQCRRYELRFKTKTYRAWVWVDSAQVKSISTAIISNTDRYTLVNDSAITNLQVGGFRLKAHLNTGVLPTDSVALSVEVYRLSDKCLQCGVGGSDLTFTKADIWPDCPYPGKENDLTLLSCNRSSTGAGARWEAFIRDVRDCNIYRTVQMPDGSWWFAQNLNWEQAGKCYPTANSCDTVGRVYTWFEAVTGTKYATLVKQYIPGADKAPQGVCPAGWHVPTTAEWQSIVPNDISLKDATSFDAKWGMSGMRDGFGFTWRPAKVDAELGVAGSAIKEGLMWTVPPTWEAYNAISRVSAKSAEGNWASNPISIDGSMGSKLDYLHVRCKYGLGEAVLPDGTGAPLSMGAITLTSDVTTTLAGGKLLLQAAAVNPPAQAGYRWVVTPTGGGPEWTIATSSVPQVMAITPNVTGSNATYSIKVTVTAAGYTSASSNSINITVRACQPLVQAPLTTQNVCPGIDVPLNPGSATGGDGVSYTYTWERRVEGTSTWETAGNQVSYTITGIGATGPYYYYRRTVTSCEGTGSNTTNEAYVGVYSLQQPNVGTSSDNRTYCNSGNYNYTMGAAYGGKAGDYTYEWQYSTVSAGPYSATSPACTTEHLTVPALTTTLVWTGYYRRLAHTCSGALTHYSQPVRFYTGGAVPSNGSLADVSVCPDPEGTVTRTLNPSASGTGTLTYQWRVLDGSTWKNVAENGTSQAYNAPVPTIANTTKSYLRVTYSCSGAGASASSGAYHIVATGGITADNITAPAEVCPGISVSCTAPAVAGAQSYEWYASNDGGGSYSLAAGVNSAQNYSYTSNDTIGSSIMLKRRVYSTACPDSYVESTAVKITVSKMGLTQETVMTPAKACAGVEVPFSIGLSGGSGATLQYQWQTSADGTSDWADVVGGTNSQLLFTANNGDITPVFYRRIVATCTNATPVQDTSVAFKIGFHTADDITIAPMPVEYKGISALFSRIGANVTAQGPVDCVWEQSADNFTWANATDAPNDSVWKLVAPYTLEYSPYYRLKIASCGATKYSNVTRIFSPYECPYNNASNDLVAGSCEPRTAGRQNWQAYMIDARDEKQYRMVLMPDRKWWLAQNLNYQQGLTRKDTAAYTTGSVYFCNSNTGFQTYNTQDNIPCETFGASYNWYTVMKPDGVGDVSAASVPIGTASTVRGICPQGWYVPSHYDWGVMQNGTVGCPDGQETGVLPCNCADNVVERKGNGQFLISSVVCSTAQPNTATYACWAATAIIIGSDDYGFSLLPGTAVETGFGYSNHTMMITATEYNNNVWQRMRDNNAALSLRSEHGYAKTAAYPTRCIKAEN
ncbi:MAG: hypothetical protein LBK47_01640 [Prevotellaceae bacterium]|nr:hypothetical protein [Prevotellaceae bacterium]